jgi:integrase
LNRYVIKPVNAILHYGNDAKLCAPTAIRGFPSTPIKPRAAASQEWVASFVHACDERDWHYVGTYALFLHVTAARPSEAMVLGPQHLELEKKIGMSEPTKTGTYRVFHLTDELVRRFRLYPAKRLQWGKGKGDLRLFGYADAQGPDEIWDRVCEEAGLPRFTPYQAGRKSFASTLISQRREDVKTAAEIGNWSDVNILLKHYVTPHDIAGFVNRNFEGLLARNWQAQKPANLQAIEIEEKKAANDA